MPKKDTYQRVPCDLSGKGIVLLFDKEVIPPSEFAFKFLKSFFRAAWLFFRRDKREKEWKDKKDKAREKIITFAQLIPGLNGIESPSDNMRVLVFTTTDWQYDRELLQKSLGTAYASYVAEDFHLTILLPADQPGLKERIIQAIKPVLAEIDQQKKKESGTTLGELVTEEVKLRILEKDLNQALKEGKIKLLAGTRVPVKKWTVSAKPLKTQE